MAGSERVIRPIVSLHEIRVCIGSCMVVHDCVDTSTAGRETLCVCVPPNRLMSRSATWFVWVIAVNLKVPTVRVYDYFRVN